MAFYKKKPVVIEAIRFIGTFENFDEICEWAKVNFPADSGAGGGVSAMYIKTMEGEMRADKGDYIIRGVQCEFYPCKSDIFKMTYEPLIKPVSEETGPLTPQD